MTEHEQRSLADEHSKSPVLEVEDLQKTYGAVRAVRGVTFSVRAGEVVGLLGDNGAGKSTIVRCIAGMTAPDRGAFRMRGENVTIASPAAAKELGIEVVHQDLMLVGSLDVAANMFLHREVRSKNRVLRRLGWMDKATMERSSVEILERLHIRIPAITTPVEALSGGQRQAIAVGRAVSWGREIVLMDEPVAALGVEQSRHVVEVIGQLQHSGVAVILITHNLEQAVEVCHRALVMRHGSLVGDVATADVTLQDLVALITGAAPAMHIHKGDVSV